MDFDFTVNRSMISVVKACVVSRCLGSPLMICISDIIGHWRI